MKSRRGRVLEISGGTYRVEAGPAGGDLPEPGGGEVLECSLRGRIKEKDEERVAVGDRVEVEELDDGSCRVASVLDRESALSRRSVSRRREQVIAANVDQLAAVTSVTEPEPDLRLTDRLLVLAELNGLAGLVVANKVDLRDAEELRRIYGAAGYEVLATSAKTGRGLDELDERLSGRTTVLAGASGVGKSSLLNALVPGLDLRTSEVGRRGRHTTVSATMHPFGDRGYVVDTPGLQYLALWQVDPAHLAWAFPEFRPHVAECRFSDCRHLAEPGCGVKAAVETGEIAERRHESYRSLLEAVEEEREPGDGTGAG